MVDTTVSASSYLAAQTASLESQAPVPASSAHAAQVPLQSFDLPVFPQEAFSANLTSLILTADIKLDEYTSLLEQAFSIPALPPSITSLTLELFALGYPPAFLSELGKALSNIKSLTLYSQLFGGTTEASRNDAITFIAAQNGLREAHFLDVFTTRGFMGQLADALGNGLKFLGLSYTFRHSDPEGFRASLPVADLGKFLKTGLVALTVAIVAPNVTLDEEDREGTEEGIIPVAQKDGRAFVEKLKGGEGEELLMLDITMVEVDVEDIKGILEKCGKLTVLNASVQLVDGWAEIFYGLRGSLGSLKSLEFVGVPEERLVEKLKNAPKEREEQLTESLLEKVSNICPLLRALKVSILRTKVEHWVRGDGGAWEKQT